MKNLLLAAVAALTLSYCISSNARDHVVVPSLVQAWGDTEFGVMSDTQRGIADAVEDGDLIDDIALLALVQQLDDALSQGARPFMIRPIDWTVLEPFAERGVQDRVDDGEISQQIADFSFMERIRRFGQLLGRLQTMIVHYPASPNKEHWLPNGGGVVTSAEAVATLTTSTN